MTLKRLRMKRPLKRLIHGSSASQLLEEALLIGISLCIAAAIFTMVSKVTGQLGTSLGQIWENIARIFSDYLAWF